MGIASANNDPEGRAILGHPTVARQCPLSELERTSQRLGEM